MKYESIDRHPQAFQQAVPPELIEEMCRRAFGPRTEVRAAVELGDGMYNSTYRLELGGGDQVVLRVAPEPARQFRSERRLMRNEYAALPYLAPVAHLVPRVLAVDFTHQLVGRDYLFQTLLGGLPAPQGLPRHPRPAWRGFYAQLGSIAREINEVRGPWFGPVAGPGHRTWGESVVAGLTDLAADLAEAGVETGDVEDLIRLADRHRAVLDRVTEPRLLHGDLWNVNLMVAADTPDPVITGVLDCDRAGWGDPEADWTVFMACRRPGTERDAFWDTWGPLATDPGSRWRRLLYTARHTAAIRLEAVRLRDAEQAAATVEDLGALLERLDEGVD
ncbi:phosphotransferase family protein [Kitasatospora sp. NPDC093550]|uniref:phosphotransferase family protein n=1 Tax=Kitasatospora sp. NPDC093550 TaxID=3364089 RepID=UPI0037F74990